MGKINNRFELSRLKNMMRDDVIKDKSLSEGFKNGGVVAGANPAINTNEIVEQITPEQRLDKVAKFRADRAAKKLAEQGVGLVDEAASIGGKILKSPMTKKAALVLGGPVAMGLSTASDVMASDDVGAGSDLLDPEMLNEDFRQNSPEEQLDESQLSPEEVHRWSKIRGMMNR